MTVSSRPENVWISIHRIATIGMPLLLAVTGYFLTDVYGKMSVMDSQIRELQVGSATTNGNRFSSVDWIAAKDKLDDDRNLLDRRITRLEEAIPRIDATMLRIEAKLDKPAP